MIYVTSWMNLPDGNIMPVLHDDREKLPPEVVKLVLQWLDSRLEEFQHDGKPTDQLIQATEPTRFLNHKGQLQQLEPMRVGIADRYEFEAGTAEILNRHKATKTILSKNEFLTARCIRTGYVVAGPWLRRHKLSTDL